VANLKLPLKEEGMPTVMWDTDEDPEETVIESLTNDVPQLFVVTDLASITRQVL
jgi:hypothetical protein